MEKWIRGIISDEYPPTWEGLYELLDDAKFSEVSKELRKAVAKEVNSFTSEEEVSGDENVTDDDGDYNDALTDYPPTDCKYPPQTA